MLVDSDLGKEVGSVLAKAWRVLAAPVHAHPNGRGDLQPGRLLEHQTSRTYLRMIGHLLQLQHRLAADVEARESGRPLVSAARYEHGGDLRPQALLRLALGVLIVDQIEPAESVTERPPELRLQSAHRHEATVCAFVDAIAGVPTGQAMHATLGRSLGTNLGKWHGEPAQRTIRHGDVQVASLTAAGD